MKSIKTIVILIALCFSQFFIQCGSDDKKGIEEKTGTENYTDEIIMLRNFLSTSLPMDIKKIIYDSDMGGFIIGGDILMLLEDARDHYNYSNSNMTSKTNQRGSEYKMSLEISASIKVFVSPEVPSDWKIAINKAVNSWNTFNSSINITIVNTLKSANIKIIAWNGGSSKAIAYASLPYYSGNPGYSISINTYYNFLDPANKWSTMIHELGHSFGLNHTDELVGPLIPCTPLSDKASVMHSSTNSSIDYYDNVAISTLYPVSAGTKKLYRYKKAQYYFYSTNPCEITPGKDSYVFDGDAGYLYSTQIAGTVPLYRIVNGTTVKDHRLNKIQATSNDVILGYLFPTQQPGTTALYSYGIYESKPGQTPSYMYHYNYTTTNSEAILKIIVGYVSNKTIIKESPKYPILL